MGGGARAGRNRSPRTDFLELRSGQRVPPLAGRSRFARAQFHQSSSRCSRPAIAGGTRAEAPSTPGSRCFPASGRLPKNENGCRTRLSWRRRGRSMANPAWQLDPNACTARRVSECPLSLNAIAKGEIVERACAVAMRPEQGVRGVLINLGGDLRIRGVMSRTLGIASPWADSESSPPLTFVSVENCAVATSGSSQRGYQIGGKWFSHVLDPRTGLPADESVSATVIASRSADADALATICNVLEPAESLRLVRSIPGAECLIVEKNGRVTRSTGWGQFEGAPSAQRAMVQSTASAQNASAGAAAPGNQEFELVVNFEINAPEGGGRRYRRPYVAVWVEDEKGFPVRNLVLWVSMGGAGPFQWLPDLKRWYRADLERKQVEKKDLFFTIARPTRQPGKYKVVWDGKDEPGQARPARRIHDPHRCRARARNLSEPPQEGGTGGQAFHGRTERRRRDQGRLDRVSPQAPGEAVRVKGFSVSQRPLRRRLAIRFARLARWLHIYVSMFGLAAVLFFSATGITLNHPDWFFGEARRSVQSEGTIDPRLLHLPVPEADPDSDEPTDFSSQVAKLDVVEALRKTHGIGGALTDFRVDEAECTVTFKGPGYAADAFIDRDSGHYTLTQSFHGVIAVLNDLHKGRDTGLVWSILIDASAILLCVISLSGLVLLFYLKLRRIPGTGGRRRGRDRGPGAFLPGRSVNAKRVRGPTGEPRGGTRCLVPVQESPRPCASGWRDGRQAEVEQAEETAKEAEAGAGRGRARSRECPRPGGREDRPGRPRAPGSQDDPPGSAALPRTAGSGGTRTCGNSSRD